MKQLKTDKELEARLLSARTVTVLSALNEIKERGNAAYLPLLFSLLNSNPEPEVEKELTNILGTLKIKDAIPFLTDALLDPKFKPIRKELIIACWQNGLDYRSYLPLFIDIIINEDWETGFEAFTVIENMESFPDQQLVDLSVEKINSALPQTTDRKKYLLQEILLLIC
ncbi:MAG TPA: HEAT repeat domain-containing protein [Mariniphaga sp.]|nr:HEAT repeat domain-containing protein [Mariniphaga sp.]